MPPRVPKHRQVYAALEESLRSGQFKQGDRLPSEAELVRRYGASRITVGRAMRDLREAGLVERRPGSGTYVKGTAAAPGLSFGLLIPDLGEAEIFEPICEGMTSSPSARDHVLIRGASPGTRTSKQEWAWALAMQYVARRVAGVFFAPLELVPDKDAVNRRIADALDAASIPVVLLDRPVLPYPQRGPHDLVGIDNRRAGYVVTEHLVARGRRRVAFVAAPHAASTVEVREAGYRDALGAAGVVVDRSLARRLDPSSATDVAALLEARPDGVVCANDRTAAHLMQTAIGLGVAVPDDLAFVGIDDADYAPLLPVPLTTLRQPARAIGDAAMSAMLERVQRRTLPARDILLRCELVVRRSSG